MISARIILITLATLGLQLFTSPALSGETLDSTQYEQYVQLKRVMVEMELWDGEVPMDLLRLEKDLSRAWTSGDRRGIEYCLSRAQQVVNDYRRWVVPGQAAMDALGDVPVLLTVIIEGDQVTIDPPRPAVSLVTGVGKLFQINLVNKTNGAQRVRIESSDLFRVGRNIDIPAKATLPISWLFRTMEVFPKNAELLVKIGDKDNKFQVNVIPEVDSKKPLVGLAIHIPGYGRYERVRLGGKSKPSPDQVKKNPELIRPVRIDQLPQPQQEEVRIHYLSLQSHPAAIYRLPGDWDFLELQRDRFYWDYIDANIQDIRRLTRAIPVLYVGYQPWWVKETRNPNGTYGLKDPRNQNLVAKYRQYIRKIAEHTGNQVQWFELWNEPIIYWFYDENSVPRGPRYVSEYGEMLKSAIGISVEELRKGVPDSWIISPGFVDQDMFPSEWSMVNYLIDRGMLDQVDALCLHKYPFGVDVTPPPGKSVNPWIDLDHRTDETPTLIMLQEKGHGDTPLWCTEAGGFGNGRLDGLADLHVGSIMAHQGFCGLHFTSLPVSLHLLAEAVNGATPVEWGSIRKMNSTYSGVVVKTFTRGPEDIIIIWNNSEEIRSFTFVPPDPMKPHKLLMVEELSEPLGGPANHSLLYTREDLDGFYGKSFRIGRLEWKAFLVIPEEATGFQWLSRIDGAEADPRYKEIEQLWNEVRTYQREVFSGNIGTDGDRRSFKDSFGGFVKAWWDGRTQAAQGRLEVMVRTERRLRKY